MKKRMYVGLFMLLFCMIFAVTALPITAKADMGPKPSVRIQFKNMSDDLCYGTLLSKEKCTGPAQVWDGTARNEQLYDLDRNIWKAFVDYKDPDGYYFLQSALWRSGIREAERLRPAQAQRMRRSQSYELPYL